MGQRREFSDPRAACHWTARDIALQQEPDFVFLDNVIDFCVVSYLESLADKYVFKMSMLRPGSRSYPAAGAALWQQAFGNQGGCGHVAAACKGPAGQFS